MRRYSNLGALRRNTFENTRPDGLLNDGAGKSLFRKALAASVDFAEAPRGWLILTGPSGSGKTHLAAAITNRCIDSGRPAYFIAVADLLDHLRATYAPDSGVSYDELFDQVRNAPILALDDLAPRSTTLWAQEKLFQIISHRFNESLPTIITVRGQIERLDEGLRTRMEKPGGFSEIYQLGEHSSRQAREIVTIPEDLLKTMTFENFNVYGRPDTSAAGRESLFRAWQAAKGLAANPTGWLLLTGERGCGKTHLAVAIGGECLKQGYTVHRAFVSDLLDHLRATFRPNSDVTYDDLFEQVKMADLLILDDLGAQGSTPWAEEKLFQIVVYRYDLRLPTVITSVGMVHELTRDWPNIGSRLVDGALVDWQHISAPNYRDQRRQGPGAGRS